MISKKMSSNSRLSLITFCILTIIQTTLTLNDGSVSKVNRTNLATRGSLDNLIPLPFKDNSTTTSTASPLSSLLNLENHDDGQINGKSNFLTHSYPHE